MTLSCVDLDDRLTVTIQRTADVLDIGRSSVYQLLRAGKLKGVKFGRAHRIVVQSIRDLVAESWDFEKPSSRCFLALRANLQRVEFRFSERGVFALEMIGQRTRNMKQRISQHPASTTSESTQERSQPRLALLTPKEVAARLRVSLSFLAKARMRGNGPPFIAIGRSVRYSETALLLWMRAHQRLSTSQQ